MDIDEIVENFEVLEPGEERYRFLIELGKELPGLPDAFKTDEHIVRGCLSRVWMTAERDGDRLHLLADSDAFIVRGLIAILLALYDGRTVEEIAALDPQQTFATVGLEQHLSLGRRNGLHAMVQRIRALAAQEPSLGDALQT